MSRRERFANDAASTLDGQIDAAVTSLDVISAADFPAEGDFRIVVDNEIMLVTGVSSNTFTVVRARENTTGVTHGDGVSVIQIITVGGLQRYVRDGVSLFNDSALPKSNYLVDDADAVLTASNFTAVNQGTSTLTDYNSGGLLLFVPGPSATSVRFYKRAAPTPAYTLTAQIPRWIMPRDVGLDQGSTFGIGLRDASGVKLLLLSFAVSGQICVSKMTSPTVWDSDVAAIEIGISSPLWLQIEDNTTNHIFRYSVDGQNWLTLLTQSRTNWLATPDEIGLHGNILAEDADGQVVFSTWIEE